MPQHIDSILTAVLQFALVDTLTKSSDSPDFSKFHIWITSIKRFPEMGFGFCPMNDNHDDRQNGHHLSVCTCGHFYFYSFITRFFPNFICIVSITFFNFEYGYQDGRHNGYPFFTAWHYAGPFIGVRLFYLSLGYITLNSYNVNQKSDI